MCGQSYSQIKKVEKYGHILPVLTKIFKRSKKFISIEEKIQRENPCSSIQSIHEKTSNGKIIIDLMLLHVQLFN